MGDIDTAVVVESLKALDPKWPIREADIWRQRKIRLKGHVWTYMDPARLQHTDWIRCNSHNC